MRSDMFKVIVEKPRRGGGDADPRHKYSLADLDKYEDLPASQGMRRRFKDRKSLNENLSPLYRFLESRVGSRWDDVYSEICEHLRPTSTVQQHVRDHLSDYVDVNGRIDPETGRLVFFGRWGHETWDHPLYDFWVDPRDGILRSGDGGRYGYRRWWRRDKPKEPDVLVLGDIEIRRDLGIWYEVVWGVARDRSYIDTEGRRHRVYDTDYFTGKAGQPGDTIRIGRRQASKKLLRRFGVSNLPANPYGSWPPGLKKVK